MDKKIEIATQAAKQELGIEVKREDLAKSLETPRKLRSGITAGRVVG